MKRFIVYGLVLIIGMVFCVGACNTPDSNPGGGGDEGEEVNITDGGVYKRADFSGTGYPGFEVSLATVSPGTVFADISQYASVIVDAVLYSAYTDEDANTIATLPEGENKNLAQFTLLTETGSWPDDNGRGAACGPTQYNMAVNGKTTWNVTSNSTGVPARLLVQVNDSAHKDAIAAIKIKTIDFIPKTSDVVLDVMYNNGDFIEIHGNAITFKNATGGDAAAVFLIPAEWGGTETNHDPLKNRTITFTYRIPAHTCVPSGTLPNGETEAEHQLRIQAAYNKENKYNGADSSGGNPGQQYIDDLQPSGSFTVPANKLIEAAEANNGTGTPFVLTSIRILNDGTTYQTFIRCKSYTLIFDSITIGP